MILKSHSGRLKNLPGLNDKILFFERFERVERFEKFEGFEGF